MQLVVCARALCSCSLRAVAVTEGDLALSSVGVLLSDRFSKATPRLSESTLPRGNWGPASRCTRASQISDLDVVSLVLALAHYCTITCPGEFFPHL
ncbi:hypothetical protein PAXRUDRAFT_538377 [Paxillus rubicundulus Ve08.2h10]|uniref:Uncharacterized protein n=1 Tax=Paxillus rubicundulus Ve08.2h10 TaxID=930991 RepID=A0A0D0EDA7_9AGAM|nr:hypothetical protein PAXRUDRAFT_538377 [Paxillus rubicundulus Ve08.2h10]